MNLFYSHLQQLMAAPPLNAIKMMDVFSLQGSLLLTTMVS